jgi:hypothetical protein
MGWVSPVTTDEFKYIRTSGNVFLVGREGELPRVVFANENLNEIGLPQGYTLPNKFSPLYTRDSWFFKIDLQNAFMHLVS